MKKFIVLLLTCVGLIACTSNEQKKSSKTIEIKYVNRDTLILGPCIIPDNHESHASHASHYSHYSSY